MAGAQSGAGVARQPLNLRHSSHYSHESQENTPTPPAGQRSARESKHRAKSHDRQRSPAPRSGLRNCPAALPGRWPPASPARTSKHQSRHPTHASSSFPLPDKSGRATASLGRVCSVAHGRCVGPIRLSRNPMPLSRSRSLQRRSSVRSSGAPMADAGGLAALARARVSAHALPINRLVTRWVVLGRWDDRPERRAPRVLRAPVALGV
jgi:hypothetical protein